MGMAASQARLLTLTSRLQDIEYKAQNIESQKIALATQQDKLYQDYCDALDATKIQVAFSNGDGTRRFVDANFSTVCGYDANRFMQYSLTNNKTGNVIVDDKTAEAYEGFSNDKYSFAFAMLGLSHNDSWDDPDTSMGAQVGIGAAQENYGDGKADNGNFNLYMTDVEKKVFESHKDDSKLTAAYDEITNAETDSDKRKALSAFRDMLYGNDTYVKEIYNYQRLNKGDSQNTEISEEAEYDTKVDWGVAQNEFQYYLNLFDQIQAAGGCEVIDPQYVSGDEANTWFNNMVESGMVTISTFNGNEWKETSVATSTNQNYLQEAQNDADMKKAEAEYKHELSIINRKDSKYDRDLSNLETERTAIKTEMDSIKQVRNDNIERTFGIFS